MDECTLAQAAIHDHAAFELLYQRHVTRIYRYALACTGQVQDAQDITAQTFMTALSKIKDYRGEGTFAAWLTRIAHRKIIDFHRQQAPTLPLELVESLPTSDQSPEEQVMQRLRLEAVQEQLHHLPVEQGRALMLRYFGGLSLAEIAQVLGKSEAAVKMLLQRVLHTLRERIEADHVR